ncbi:Retrovirus-related Pol polyprotein from transposon gypsy, partial [Mucuna pruriens]
MCVDYKDLNRAIPKDDFPLPHIDVLVNNTAKHGCFSFMDGFSRYNQIRMASKDMEKTTFITQWGTFCYRVMPFGLKNAGAIYQRAMVALFYDMMHKNVKVYVDDMIAKSKTDKEHIRDLRKLFERLRKYEFRLNPAKCTFGVKSRKLLWFVVSKKGIEVDLDKVKAIQEMSPPQTKKEIRGFWGRLNYIAKWIEDYQKAFKEIKRYLKEPPILVPPVFRRPLIISFGSQPSVDYQPTRHDFLDEDILMLMGEPEQEKGWTMFFDGASNTLGHGIGAVLISLEECCFPFIARLGFNYTNNMAKYEAYAMGITMALEY